MKKQFYEKLLPTQGVYCAVGLKDEVRRHYFADTLDALIKLTEKLKSEGLNVYVAPNSFAGHSRQAKNALYGKSMFVDLDVGIDQSKYQSKNDAIEALDRFITEVDLPPPTVVDSGTGIQAFWILDADLPIAEWKHCAESFKALCIKQGLKIDPTVTADAARIMRCPDTLNYKTDPPRQAMVLSPEVDWYDVSWFREFIAGIHGTTTGELTTVTSDGLFGLAPEELDADLATIFHKNKKAHFSDLVVLSLKDKGCNQIKNMVVNAKTLPYDLWTAGLSIAVKCLDGETAIHDLSEEHPKYNRDATIAKANSEWNSTRTCKWFRDNHPAHCEGCPHSVPAPIALAEHIQLKPYAEEVDQAESIRLDANPQAVPLFPKFLEPFAQGATGGVCFIKRGTDDEPDTEEQILNHLFYPLKRVVGGTDGEALIMRQVKPRDEPLDVTLPVRQIAVLSELSKFMGGIGEILNTQKQTQLVSNYLKRWLLYLQEKETAEIMRLQMGWTEKNDAFVVGLEEIRADGTRRPAAAAPAINSISKRYSPIGTYAAWQEGIKIFNRKEFEIHAFAGPLAGLGATLMRFTASPGGSIALASVDTGRGKSACISAANGLWGQPKKLSINDGTGATYNGLMQRLLTIKNMPLCIDETGNIDPKALGQTIHQVAQGQGKIRLQGSDNREREYQSPSSTIAIFGGNGDYIDILRKGKDGNAGEIARFIQFNLVKPSHWNNRATGRSEMEVLVNNAGWAGPIFIEYLFKVGEEHIRECIKRWDLRFAAEFPSQMEHRYHADIVSSCMASGELASEAGLFTFDLDRIFNRVVLELQQLQDDTMKHTRVDYRQYIAEFYLKNIDKFLIVTEGNTVISEPRNELVGRIVQDRGIFIVRNAFTDFIAKKNISTRECMKALKTDGVFIGPKKMRIATGWKPGTSAAGTIWALEFASSLLDDLTKDAE